MILVLVICNDIVTVSNFKSDEKFGMILFIKITALLYYIHTTCNVISFYWMPEVLPNFITEWQKLQEQFKKNASNVTIVRKGSIFIVTFSVISRILTLNMTGHALFSGNSVYDEVPYKLSSVIWNKVLKVVLITVIFHTTMVWFLSSAFVLLICK